MATWIIQNMSTEARKNMETIRINIKNIMLGMIIAGTMGMIIASTVGIITAGTVGMPTIITEALRNIFLSLRGKGCKSLVICTLFLYLRK